MCRCTLGPKYTYGVTITVIRSFFFGPALIVDALLPQLCYVWQLNTSRCTILGAWPHEQLIPCVRILPLGDSEVGTLSPTHANIAFLPLESHIESAVLYLRRSLPLPDKMPIHPMSFPPLPGNFLPRITDVLLGARETFGLTSFLWVEVGGYYMSTSTCSCPEFGTGLPFTL